MRIHYSCVLSKERIVAELGPIATSPAMKMRYNIAASAKGYVALLLQEHLIIREMTWGLIPNGSRTDRNATHLTTADVDGITTKTSFRMPFRRQRCLVLADSFYLWSKEGLPYRISRRDGRLLTFAGLWDEWESNAGRLQTFAMITNRSNKEVFGIYPRMPVCLEDNHRMQWLGSSSIDEHLALLQSPANGTFTMQRVTERVAQADYSTSELHAPVPDIKTLFDH